MEEVYFQQRFRKANNLPDLLYHGSLYSDAGGAFVLENLHLLPLEGVLVLGASKCTVRV
jgi:hypothetical protein